MAQISPEHRSSTKQIHQKLEDLRLRESRLDKDFDKLMGRYTKSTSQIDALASDGEHKNGLKNSSLKKL